MSLLRTVLPEMARMARAFEDPFLLPLRRGGAFSPSAAGALASAFGGPRIPAMDVHENDKEYVVVAELPGVAKDAMDVSIVDGNTLSIHATAKAEFSAPSSSSAAGDANEGLSPTTGGEALTDTATAPNESAVKSSPTAATHQLIAQERVIEDFQRTVTFPHRIDPGQLMASFKDGLLTVTVPKAAPQVERVQVKIE
ncbi:hypothetical protein H9P43_008126 [Blastocladiella emersonii ATCC 22665]|uniref:Heat shock protein 30 n=1 Tax=Blastocladiella emersonii TaxID=4808 RepID=A0A6M5WPZ5_BLAEM|nr:hypothetical protein H9P43_008126 [Blastocladiella emersonii ATCC 22665]QJW70211.1 heat shock protein 30 [Blastocladiella emersonii]